MKLLPVVMSLAMISGPALLAQSGSGSPTQAAPAQIQVGQTVEPSAIFDRGVGGIEKEYISLAEAIPAEKWSYSPTEGDHKGVQSLEEMFRHVAQANSAYFGAVLGQKPDMKAIQDAKGKDAVIAQLKQSFQLGHQAAASLTPQNAFVAVAAPFGNSGVTRTGAMVSGIAHAFDHYGHLTEYARDIGIVPPSSRK